jgi:hypothetical protein
MHTPNTTYFPTSSIGFFSTIYYTCRAPIPTYDSLIKKTLFKTDLDSVPTCRNLIVSTGVYILRPTWPSSSVSLICYSKATSLFLPVCIYYGHPGRLSSVGRGI